MLDPGIGFGKTPEQSITMIARLSELRAFGLPLLVGLSRKRFIDSVSPSKPQQRIGGSIAANVLAVLRGAAIVRVHDVAETVQALRVVAAIQSPWLTRSSGSAAMSATYARRWTRRSRCFADGKDVRLTARSSDYATPPWGVTDQPPFINLRDRGRDRAFAARAARRAHCRSSARSAATARTSSAGGRARIDIDLLAYDDVTLDEPGLTLPHPRLFERAFVLVPLAEIVPERLIGGRHSARRRWHGSTRPASTTACQA